MCKIVTKVIITILILGLFFVLTEIVFEYRKKANGAHQNK